MTPCRIQHSPIPILLALETRDLTEEPELSDSILVIDAQSVQVYDLSPNKAVDDRNLRNESARHIGPNLSAFCNYSPPELLVFPPLLLRT